MTVTLSRHAQSLETRPLRIVHLSDIHFWRYAINPLRLLSKRLVGMTVARCWAVPATSGWNASRELVDRVNSLRPDHILITGDLTTTALPSEFRAARAALADWLDDPARVTIVPGNHDRYTLYAPSLPPLRALLRRVRTAGGIPVATLARS